MSIVNFLVYKTQNQGQTETELEKLGYAKVTKRNDYDCHFWHLNECIILVKGDPAYTGFAAARNIKVRLLLLAWEYFSIVHSL